MKDDSVRTNKQLSEFSEDEKIDKKSYLPAYAQLAAIIRQRISNGVYPPGARLPSEAAFAGNFGISAMTARQAIGILAEEGLVNRVQGRGTFVKRLEFTSSSFGLDALRELFRQKEDLEARIIKATVEAPRDELRKVLRLKADGSVISVERLVLYEKEPLIFHVSYARADPESPFVETMLNTDVLTGILFETNLASFKKAELRLLPASLDQREAKLLQLPEGTNVFKLEHIYFDFTDLPSAFGWFLIAPDKMPLICRMGVWHD